MTLYRAFLNGYVEGFQVVEGLLRLIAGDEAKIPGAWCRICRLGVEGMVCLVEIDLLLAELESPATVSFGGFKSEDASVEGDRCRNACNGEDEVVEAVYLHGFVLT